MRDPASCLVWLSYLLVHLACHSLVDAKSVHVFGSIVASSESALLSRSTSGWQLIDSNTDDRMTSSGYIMSFTINMWKGSTSNSFLFHTCSRSSTSRYTCTQEGSAFALPNTGLNTYAFSGTTASFSSGVYLGIYFPAGSSSTVYPMVKPGPSSGNSRSYTRYANVGTGTISSYTASSDDVTMAVTWYTCLGYGSNCDSTCPAAVINNGVVTYSQVPVTTGPFVIGTVATFSCNSGYNMIGSSTSTCLHTDGYEFIVPECRFYCPAVILAHGQVVYSIPGTGPFVDETVATFSCDDGFYISGSSTSTCMYVSGIPQFVVPSCLPVACAAVIPPPHIAVTYSPSSSAPFAYNTVASYTCDIGYELVGAAESICDNTNAFNPTPPSCVIISCPATSISSGFVSYNHAGPSPYPYGTVATFSCLSDEYRMIGSSTSTCLATTGFDSPTCEFVECPAVTWTTGSVTYSQTATHDDMYRIGTIATFTCNNGLYVRGSSTSTCTLLGAFIVPECGEASCTAPIFANGVISYSTGYLSAYDIGTIATFSCYAGFQLVGSDTSTCTMPSMTFENIPTCYPITCPAVTLSNGAVTYSVGGPGPYPWFSQAIYNCNTNYIFDTESFSPTLLQDATNKAHATCLTGAFEVPECVYPDIYALPAASSSITSHYREIRVTGAIPNAYYALISQQYFAVNVKLKYLSSAPSGGCHVTWTPCWYRPQSYITEFSLLLWDRTNLTARAGNFSIGPTVYINGSLATTNVFIPLTNLGAARLPSASLENSYIYIAATRTTGVIRQISFTLGPIILTYTHSDSFFNFAWTINSTTMAMMGSPVHTMSSVLSQGQGTILTNAVRALYGITGALPDGVILLHGLLGQSWLNVAYQNWDDVNNDIQGRISDYRVPNLHSTAFVYSLATF